MYSWPLWSRRNSEMRRATLVFIHVILYCCVSNAQEYRSISGHNNNAANPDWGSVEANLERISDANYQDGIQTINAAGLPLPRVVSTALFTQEEGIPEPMQLSGYVWMFGQFLAHDIVYIEKSGLEVSTMRVSADDTTFGTGANVSFARNEFDSESATSIDNPREYNNQVSSFIDGSMIYGSSQQRADWLRTFQGGKLKISTETLDGQELLPWNTTTGEFNDQVDFSSAIDMIDESDKLLKYFVAGDVRANENVLLLCLQTIFLREHNRLCENLAVANPRWDDEKIYQEARKLVGAYIQSIAFNEWLPAVGVFLPEYRGYDSTLNPVVFNEFSAAAISISQTLANSSIVRMNNTGEDVNEGSLLFGQSLYNPFQVLTVGGPDAYLKGMGTQVMQDLDSKIIPELQNHVFANNSEIGIDYAASNIFRGRDRGLVGYNTMRSHFGLPPLTSFDELSESAEDVEVLEALYGDIDNVDAWVGMMSEPRVYNDALFGELVMAIYRDQFRLLRDGDRFFYENDEVFSQEQIADIKSTTLHDIIVRNTGIELMQESVFSALNHIDIPNLAIPENNLEALVYPNPITSNSIVKIHSDEEIIMSYSMIGSNGQLVHFGEFLLQKGQENYMTLPFNENSNLGYYELVLSTSSSRNSVKLLKIR